MTDIDVRSPCISVCKLDKSGVCVGCYRTIDEIRDWYRLDNDGRRLILEQIKNRTSYDSTGISSNTRMF